MKVQLNNRLLTIVNLCLLAVAVLFSIGWVLDIEYCKAISTGLFYLFLILGFVQIVFKGSLLVNRLFFNLLIGLNFVPILVSLVSVALFDAHILASTIGVLVSSLGIVTVYSIWYAKKDAKNILDKLKLFWVILFSISKAGSFVFKIQHWPYQDIMTHVDLIAYVPLLVVFYYPEVQKLRGKDK